MPLPPGQVDAGIELVHRIVGYPLAFIVAPAAIATFAGAPGHRWAGKTYAIVMTFLYLTGSALTLTRHPWDTWDFGRNVAFNMLGFSFVLHGWRSMWLVRHPETRRTALDRAPVALLALLAAALVVLAVMKASTPVRIFAGLGVALVALEARDWRAGLTRAVLYRRHVRYMLASYFYVLTVVSLVHLKDELSSDARWLWPAAIGIVAASVIGEGARANRWAVRATLAVGLLFGVYVAWDLINDRCRGVVSPMERPAMSGC